MKQTGTLLLTLIFLNSCTEQNNSELLKENVTTSKLISTKAAERDPIPDDPSFVKSEDTISEYGPQSITRTVLQDKSGNIWLATWQGIISYNPSASLRAGGKLFTNHSLKEGLGKHRVFSILEDRNGKLWFGTVGGGVYCYDPSAHLKTGGKTFTHFTTADGLAGNIILCMFEDASGNIWFGASGKETNKIEKSDGGLSCYDGKSFTNFTIKDGLIHNSVTAMVQDNNGKIWLGTEGGLCYYDPSAMVTKFKKKEGSSFRHVQAMIKDRIGKIWIGSREGLTCFDPALNAGEKDTTNVTLNSPSYIFEDKAGKLLLSGGGTDLMALYRYDPQATKNKGIKKLFSKNDPLPFKNQIFGAIEDKAGNIWFGSSNGVYRYNPSISVSVGTKAFTDFSDPNIKR